MIIERGRVVGLRNGEASVVTASAPEGTAVFIGRASFRMIPVAQGDGVIARNDVSNDVSIEQGAGVATGSSTATSALDAAWFDQGDEKVVLSPPETSVPSESAFEEAANPPWDGSRWVDRHRSLPLWTIAAALLAGVTITLSAQAVMKRPGRFAIPTKLAEATVGAPARATVSAAATATQVPNAGLLLPPTAPRAMSPTVVPSTVIWAVNAQPTPRPISRGSSIDRPRQARAVKTPAATMRARTVTWVDPFAEGNEPSVTSATGTSDKSGGPATTARKRPGSAAADRKAGNRTTGVWVDPFAE